MSGSVRPWSQLVWFQYPSLLQIAAYVLQTTMFRHLLAYIVFYGSSSYCQTRYSFELVTIIVIMFIIFEAFFFKRLAHV